MGFRLYFLIPYCRCGLNMHSYTTVEIHVGMIRVSKQCIVLLAINDEFEVCRVDDSREPFKLVGLVES